MNVRPLTILAVAVSLLTGAAGARALPAAQPAGRISATLDACHPAGDLASRYATFGAQMTAVPGSTQMSIRFELDERTPGTPGFHPVSGVPGFGMWTNSVSGVDIFGYSKEVSSLPAPAAFRVNVMYRWLGPRHRVVRRAHKTTPACVLPNPSPPSAGAHGAGQGETAPQNGVAGALCPAAMGPDPAGGPTVCA